MCLRRIGRLVAASSVALILLTGVAGAAQDDPRLNALFDKLRTTDNPAEARIVELAIWQIWSESGDPATDSLMDLGATALQGRDFAGALGLFDAITERSPDFAEGWNKRATVLYMMGASERAAEDVARVLSLEPRHFGALSGLGLIDIQLHRDNDAIAAFQQALKLNPNMPDAKAHLEELLKRRSKGAI
jgi:tetratricopeptide (TPR) repeat protein